LTSFNLYTLIVLGIIA